MINLALGSAGIARRQWPFWSAMASSQMATDVLRWPGVLSLSLRVQFRAAFLRDKSLPSSMRNNHIYIYRYIQI